MLSALVTAWTLLVKLPLSFLATGISYRPIRRSRAAYALWADEAGRGGPHHAALRVREHISYEPDPWGGVLDYVAAPAWTWARRRGDCDDFAYLTADALKRAGYAVWIINYWCWDIRSSHTVTAVKDDAGYRILDQGYLSTPYATLPAAAHAGRPPAAVAATAVTRYAAGFDLVGRWVAYVSREPEK